MDNVIVRMLFIMYGKLVIRRGLATGNINIMVILKMGSKEDLGNYKLTNFTSLPGKILGHILLESISM